VNLTDFPFTQRVLVSRTGTTFSATSRPTIVWNHCMQSAPRRLRRRAKPIRAPDASPPDVESNMLISGTDQPVAVHNMQHIGLYSIAMESI